MIRILGIAPCIYIAFIFYSRGFPLIPWGFPVTINRYQGISSFGQDQGSCCGSEGVNLWGLPLITYASRGGWVGGGGSTLMHTNAYKGGGGRVEHDQKYAFCMQFHWKCYNIWKTTPLSAEFRAQNGGHKMEESQVQNILRPPPLFQRVETFY